MNLPEEIKTLQELSLWIDENNPAQIVITEKCEIRRIREFNPYWPKERWETFKGIEIIHQS